MCLLLLYSKEWLIWTCLLTLLLFASLGSSFRMEVNLLDLFIIFNLFSLVVVSCSIYFD